MVRRRSRSNPRQSGNRDTHSPLEVALRPAGRAGTVERAVRREAGTARGRTPGRFQRIPQEAARLVPCAEAGETSTQ